MDRTSLYRALRPLERRELVRIRATADRRAKEVLLTVDGERHLARAMPHWQRAQDRFIESFGSSRVGPTAARSHAGRRCHALNDAFGDKSHATRPQ